MRRGLWTAVLFVGLVWTPAPCGAHGLNASFTEITLTPARVEVAYLLSVEDILAHFSGPVDHPGPTTLELSDGRVPEVLAFLAKHLILTTDDKPIDLGGGSYHAHANGTFIRFQFSRSIDSRPAAVLVRALPDFFERLGPLHTNVVTLAVEGRSRQGFLTVDQRHSTFSTGYRPRLAQGASLVWRGARHMFVRYEHLVFVIGLLIVLGGVMPLATVALAFALGHSATLPLAALDVLSPPALAVDGAIALTIAYVAFENFLGANLVYRRLLAFGFGAVHGFGFGSALRALDAPPSELIMTLVSFNAGIEIALVAVVAVVAAATTWLRAQRFGRLALSAASGLIFLVGVGWFFQRTFGLFVST